MKLSLLWSLIVLVVLASSCKSDTEKACFDDTASKTRISACGELCDKDDGKACVKQSELAIDACMTKHDADVCSWMCRYARDGKDLFCKEYTKQTGKPAE